MNRLPSVDFLRNRSDMPVTPAYEWEESEATVTVKVSLRGFPRGNNDMLSTGAISGLEPASSSLHHDHGRPILQSLHSCHSGVQ